jgi:thymidylate synthase (FAD)
MGLVTLQSITPDAEKNIAYMARVSSSRQDNPEISGLLKYCIKHGHWSIFEMGNMVVEIETSRGISPQILRHRSFSFQEFSQRYAAVDDSGVKIYAARRQDTKNRQNSTDDLSDDIKDTWEKRQMQNWKTSFDHYQWALANGIAKECARFVLPLGTTTKMYMQGSIRSWIHYLQLRCGNGTQKEHKDIADEIKAIFVKELPIVSEALGW